MDVQSPVGNFGEYRWTVDETEDFELVRKIYEHFLYEKHTEEFDYKDILAYLGRHPEIRDINKRFQRNEGLQKSMDEDIIVALDRQ